LGPHLQVGAAPYDEYVSDPAKPVRFRAPAYTTNRWFRCGAHLGAVVWSMTAGSSGRPDVVGFYFRTLKTPVKISGQPNFANLISSTSARIPIGWLS